MDPVPTLQQAAALQNAGRLAEAEQLCLDMLQAAPGFFQARHLLGMIWLQQGRRADALAAIETALTLAPAAPAMLASLALALQANDRLEDALQSFDQAVAAAPGNAAAWYNRGLLLRRMKRHAQALQSFDAVLGLRPNDVKGLKNRGELLLQLGRHEAALADCERLLTSQPADPQILNLRGLALRGLQRSDDALTSFEAALAIDANLTAARNNHGVTLWEMHDLEKALASFDRGLAHDPGNVELLYNRGNVLFSLKRFAEAAESFEAVLKHQPDHRFAFGSLAGAALNMCDWTRTARLGKEIAAQPETIVPPLTLLGYSDDPARLLASARHAIREKAPVLPGPLWNGVPYRHGKIRLAYLSADFHEHATAWLAAELFETHDRTRFSVTAISYGPDDGSAMRARLVQAFDRFVDAAGQSDAQIAQLLRALEIDIAIDLKGHTGGGRPAILSFRPAPVQVNFLGFPGSLGAPFIDYVIGDAIVLPFAQQPLYDEKIVHLPHSYQPNDSKRAIAAATPNRGEAGLPAAGFVFCCFNNSWKITAPVFDIWMRLLAKVPASLLWLLDDNEAATENLKAQASARGIDPARLVFAPRAALPDHLARHRLADLFLDTLPCNAHTTASDALWAGLPLLTCAGRSFAGRVAASLLFAAGLPELVTDDLDAYEALALRLAREPGRLQSFRQRLQTPQASPLFDAARFCRHIEAAYTSMWRGAEAGAPPRSFAVEPPA